jgi:predicted ATPase
MGAAASARRWRSYPHPFFHYRQCSVLVSPTPQRMTLEASVRAYDCSPDPYLMTSPSSPAVSSRRMTKRLLTVPGLARSRPAMMLPVRVCWSETWAVESEHARPGNAGVPGHLVIRTPDRRLRVFVSSTLGELAEERRAVARAVSALRMTPVMFELGARPHPPRDVYRAYVAQSDVFVGLYWQSYGQVGPGMEVSGLEDELELARGLPRLLYVRAPAPDREPRLAELLTRIRAEATVSYRRFGTPLELGRLVRDDLASLLSDRFAATVPGPTDRAPPAGRGPSPLPMGTTSLVGREQAVDDVAVLFERPEVRLVTLTGPGGVGKTRLAIAVAQRLRDGFGTGTAFVPLAAVTEPGLALAGVARAMGADLAGTGDPLAALVEQVGDDRWLLVLDNLEQVVHVAHDLGELLARCPGVAILATSRTVLGLRGEWEYPVLPLLLPADPRGASVQELAEAPAVALFVDRARAVRHDFGLTEGNAAAVAEICRRLEGLPLAIELAAARIRLLDPGALLARLARSLDALGTGSVDLPERQRTLRATVEWSVGLLDEPERSLLETAAAFVDGWTVDAAAQVAGLDEERALELSEALARHSLVQLDGTALGLRSRMLETVCVFIAERLAARPDNTEIHRRHAAYYRALAEQTDRPLRGGVGHNEWLDRLQAEAGNLAAAVNWYLAHDWAPLPHLFRILWLFWGQRDHVSDGPRLGRPAAPHRRLPRSPCPGRAAMDCAGDRQRGGRRPGGAARPGAPRAAAGRDRRPVPAGAVAARDGVDRAHRRRSRRRPARGVGEPSAAPRSGRAVLDGYGPPHYGLRGAVRGPPRRRVRPPARGT